jgi:membrane protein involved in colicin uptake
LASPTVLIDIDLGKEERDINEILSFTLNPTFSSPSSRAGAHTIMKLKSLKKKIRRLEKRLQEDPKKLAKLKQKLRAGEAAKAAKARKRSAAKSPKPSEAKKLGAVKKAKKKLNLSPERRAQLAAAMKARWAAKRAAEANAKAGSSDNQHSASPGPTPQAPENRPHGV